jgi:hypothetical protein
MITPHASPHASIQENNHPLHRLTSISFFWNLNVFTRDEINLFDF